MEEPQNRPRNDNAIVLSLRRIPRLVQLRFILLTINAPTLDSQLNLPPHHILIEAQMPLRCKQPLADVHALHLCYGAAAPNVDIAVVLLRQQGCGG